MVSSYLDYLAKFEDPKRIEWNGKLTGTTDLLLLKWPEKINA